MTENPNPCFKVSWDEFHRHAYELAKIVRKKGDWKAIAAITRGGLIPAAIIARELEIRMVGVIGIASYHEYETRGQLQVLQRASPEVQDLAGGNGEQLLVIDDLSDSGGTFRAVQQMFPHAHRASVYAKHPRGTLATDSFFITVDEGTWIVLPWDSSPGTLELRVPLAAAAQ